MGGDGRSELGFCRYRRQLPAASAALDTTDPDDVRSYADLLRREAETYFADVEKYFRCQDQERREVFVQAREFSEAYARLLELEAE